MSYDTSHALLYLGKVSREAIGYGLTRGDQDHTWSSYKKLRAAFEAKHPEHVEPLKLFMVSEKREWPTEFTEIIKTYSLSKYVSENQIKS